MPKTHHPGQRWISETEPELGLGLVEAVTPRTVKVAFRRTGETREYARDSAPLRRVRFHPGDRVEDGAGHQLLIEAVAVRDGLIIYSGGGRDLPESRLSDAMTFSTPKERLFVGQVESPKAFDLRVDALNLQHERRKSPVRGFVGGRIDLIPHQLHIASEVSGRLLPRVLLADEVGLGKTIEACLIVHRLLHTGRAQRVLILVPDSLVHQWLVEMLRRFNLWFHVFDEERCAAIEAANPDANPFLEDQLVLASIRLFSSSKRTRQALEAGWDVLVVDEAHHLEWSPETVSAEYGVVEALGRKTPGLLLLTATPEQLGMESHFARLRLLDPARFHNLDDFLKEAKGYAAVARQALKLRDAGTSQAREKLDDLLDRHGTGRVMFRNTRATVRGFPARKAWLYPLAADPDEPDGFRALWAEFAADQDPSRSALTHDFSRDPRVGWLVDLLRDLHPQKVLLICRTREKAQSLEAAVRRLVNLKMAVFHEGLTLVQRDRHAAWFAEEDGAQLLICSEIGSEGRNFQFAHHLVFFDLPIDPELVEQRIGRLDRIGQTEKITLHLPFVAGSPQEVLVHWYHSGLNAFEQNLAGGHELFERFSTEVRELAAAESPAPGSATGRQRSSQALDRLIARTAKARAQVARRMEKGRDVLLEMNSFRPLSAAAIIEEIRKRDEDAALDAFMMSVFDAFAIPVEELAPRTYRLGSSGDLIEDFPGLPASGLTVTADRTRALSREDIQFLTWDHPIVSGALDLLLGSERGNSSFALWPDGQTPGLYLEAIYVLESVAPVKLHVDRFLPPTPLRVIVDHTGADVGGEVTPEELRGVLAPGDASVLQHPEVRELLPSLVSGSLDLAERLVPARLARAREEANAHLDREIHRLRALQKVNRTVRDEEITRLVEEKASLDRHILSARLRLDALRLIQRGAG